MSNRIYRVGFSEGTILACHMLYSSGLYNFNNKSYNNFFNDRWIGCWLKAIYHGAGLYDKTISNDEEHEFDVYLNSDVTKSVIQHWVRGVEVSDYFQLLCHDILNADPFNKGNFSTFIDNLHKCMPGNVDFICCGNKSRIWRSDQYNVPNNQTIKYRTPGGEVPNKQQLHTHDIRSLLKDKRVLLVNNLAGWIGDCITNDWRCDNRSFPEMGELITINAPECFLNSGPDKNSIETWSRVVESCNNNNDYDVAIVSMGGNSIPIAEQLFPTDTVLTIGGTLKSIFPYKSPPKEIIPEYAKTTKDLRYWE